MVKCLVLETNDNVGMLVDTSGRVGNVAKTFGSLKTKIILRNSIFQGHKMAIKDIKANEPVIKYGQIIGISRVNIRAGEHVHIHNMLFSNKIAFSKEIGRTRKSALKGIKLLSSNFQGYLRSDKMAGTRNYILVVSSVNCSATVVKEVARYFEDKSFLRKDIDGVIPVVHSQGCAQTIGGQSYNLLLRTLTGWISHPNVVGAIIIGLGCEGMTNETILNEIQPYIKRKGTIIRSFNIQDIGGTGRAIEAGIKKVKDVISSLPNFKRKNLPVSLLTVALNCGGSDAYSGITANPSLGIASDILSSKGGTIVLGETPECFGAERSLIERCRLKRDKEKIRRTFYNWADIAKCYKISMNNNLAPGNIKGGISTILEKSLGAIVKGGSGKINQVLNYSGKITERGLVFMDTPGFDPVSVTGLVAGGCNLVAFTTGRGSVFGCSIAPTIKISSTTTFFNKFSEDIDCNAGSVLSENNISIVGSNIYKLFVSVASGEKTKSEKQGLGREEFVPWQAGELL
ncbi:MAG: altronate dehydratase family protein [Candidatus Omnitrophica bacterium]|nr:altronate dehydratase family protein [Candidatus Omnitrophota bacterium]